MEDSAAADEGTEEEVQSEAEPLKADSESEGPWDLQPKEDVAERRILRRA